MSGTEVVVRDTAIAPEILEAVVAAGDLAKLNPAQRVLYYKARCEAAGLDPRAKPFDYLSLQGKLVLYANKGCTEQLAGRHRIGLEIKDRGVWEKCLYVVTVRGTLPDGRFADEIGAVPLAGLKPEPLANAIMKAVTKAKRRCVLSLCGLGLMDESELDTVRHAQAVQVDATGRLPAEAVIGEMTDEWKAMEDQRAAEAQARAKRGIEAAEQEPEPEPEDDPFGPHPEEDVAGGKGKGPDPQRTAIDAIAPRRKP